MPFSHQTAVLSCGRHRDPEEGVCVMELASVLAGQRFTDRPATVSPLLTKLLQGYNDGLGDARRQTLRRFAATALGTATTAAAEQQRADRLRAFIAARHPHRTPWSMMARWFDAAAPYTFAHVVARTVERAGDDALHHETLALLDELVAAGRGTAWAGDRRRQPAPRSATGG